MVRQAAGQDIREYVGGRIFGSRIDMHCRSYPGIGHLVCVQEASELFMRSRKSTPALYSGGRIPSMEWILRKELPMRLPGRIIGRRCVCSICRR